MKNSDNQDNQNNQDNQDTESSKQKLTISPEQIEQYLRDIGLGSKKELAKDGEISKKREGERRRNKRKYIRGRLKSGKPYIPLEIRQLGKEEAARRGYEDWSHLPVGRFSDLELIKNLIEDIIGTAVDIEGITDKDIKVSTEVMERQKRALASALGIKRDGLDTFINSLIVEREKEKDEIVRVERERDALMPKIEQAIKDIREKEEMERRRRNLQPEVVSGLEGGGGNKEGADSGFNRELLAKEIEKEIEIEKEKKSRREYIKEGIEEEKEEKEEKEKEEEIEFRNIPGDDPIRIMCLGDLRKQRALCFVYSQLDPDIWGTSKAEKLFYNV
ncbi:hypothetical protein LCGC14_2356790, partial [marine sediment metagenome]